MIGIRGHDVVVVISCLAVCVGVACSNGVPASEAGGEPEPTRDGWWVSPWPLPDHDFAEASRMATGPCPEGEFVQETDWEDTQPSLAGWIGDDAIDPDSIDDYPPPPAIDTWMVRVADPSDLPTFDPSILPLPENAWVSVTCVETSPGSFGLLGDDYDIVGSDG